MACCYLRTDFTPPCRNSLSVADLFVTRPFFPFRPLRWPTLFLPFSRLFALFSPSKSALFCRAKGTAQSLERGSCGMDLSAKFGQEIPSRNLREKRSEIACAWECWHHHHVHARKRQHKKGRSFFLQLVIVAYGKLAWSLLLTVEVRFGLFVLTAENRFGHFYVWFPSIQKLDWSFVLTVPPLDAKRPNRE